MQLAALLELAAGRIGSIPGAGILPDTLPPLIQSTGAREFHASAKRMMTDSAAITKTEFDALRWETDAAIVAELAARLNA